jgi:uncharacterized Rmd1/YagE family protein
MDSPFLCLIINLMLLQYGVVICWNLTEEQEVHILNVLAKSFRVKPMPSHKAS